MLEGVLMMNRSFNYQNFNNHSFNTQGFNTHSFNTHSFNTHSFNTHSFNTQSFNNRSFGHQSFSYRSFNNNYMTGNQRNRTFSGSSTASDRVFNLCGYCRNIGHPFEGHTKKNCPSLAMLAPCRLCGASGPFNHTLSHCPFQFKTILQLKPEYQTRYLLRRIFGLPTNSTEPVV